MKLFCYSFSIFMCTLVDVAAVTRQTTQPNVIQLDQISAQILTLESKLTAEIANREALEREVESKNDLTEFLRQDVKVLNRTLDQEITHRTRIESKLSQIESVVNNIQATVDEDRGTVNKLSRDLLALEARLSNGLAYLNGSLQNVSMATDNNSARINNSSLLSAKLTEKVSNQTIELSRLGLSITSYNSTLQRELSHISSEMVSVNKNITFFELNLNELSSNMTQLGNDLIKKNGMISSYQTKVDAELAVINKTAAALDKQYATLSSSLSSIRTELAQNQSTDVAKLDQLTLDVINIKANVNHYVAWTGELNKTLSALSGKPEPTGHTEDTYFFAYKPNSQIRISQPPFFNHVMSSSGAVFDASKSLFRCSVPGLYFFTATIQKDESEPNSRVMCWLKRNGSLLVSIDAHSAFIGGSPSATNSVVLKLLPGDIVQLTQCTGSTLISTDGSSFSGVLLHAD